MDAFALLKKDHKKMGSLFARIDSDEAALSERESLFQDLKELLEQHSELEETVLYSLLEEKEATADLVEESIDDHQDMHDLLDHLEMLEKDDPEWISLFRQLRETAEHHVEEEESYLFPKARKALTRYEMEDLSNQLMQKKKHTGIVEIINDLVAA